LKKCDTVGCKKQAIYNILHDYFYDGDGKPICCLSTNRCPEHTRQLVKTLKKCEGREYHVINLFGGKEKVEFT
jgi:hypothetical protein